MSVSDHNYHCPPRFILVKSGENLHVTYLLCMHIRPFESHSRTYKWQWKKEQGKFQVASLFLFPLFFSVLILVGHVQKIYILSFSLNITLVVLARKKHIRITIALECFWTCDILRILQDIVEWECMVCYIAFQSNGPFILPFTPMWKKNFVENANRGKCSYVPLRLRPNNALEKLLLELSEKLLSFTLFAYIYIFSSLT